MAYITNRSRAPRVVYIAGANGPVGRTIAPGETASDVELHNAKDPVTAAWIKAGELVVSQTEPGAPGVAQPSQDELMAAWRERQGITALHERIQTLEAENRRLREAAVGSSQAPGGQQGSDANGGQGGSQGGGEATKPAAPNLETMSDDDLRTFLAARDVTPGNWQRPRLLREAETVKDVAPTKAA